MMFRKLGWIIVCAGTFCALPCIAGNGKDSHENNKSLATTEIQQETTQCNLLNDPDQKDSQVYLALKTHCTYQKPSMGRAYQALQSLRSSNKPGFSVRPTGNFRGLRFRYKW